ncbi:MAG: putative phospholipid-binding lipoprotein MlaA [Paracidovorax wautersii]|uniref:Putative phospholipid-binding lipoprotein MlaA n=1 Tax=Paracidovorax wautersii TaxID=1177982 RepID=A0A7V8FRD0_9BURK|nr:MAG: putative phospholipid-binding lipoprotein MlaA [Paracidovorax wautersii]
MNASFLSLAIVRKGARIVVGLALPLALAACATGPNADPRDPLEPYNRTVFKFNDAVDRAVLKPVAKGYVNTVPDPVRTSVSNFFGNLSDMWSTVNNLLQLKGQDTVESALRVTTNTVFGFGGLFDVATAMGIPRHKQDFGLTLGRWGVSPGPYFVLPLLGPSTIRDTAALPVDMLGSPIGQINDIPWRNGLTVGRVIDTRATLLPATDLLDQAALDKYLLARDAFLQLRTGGKREENYDNTDYSAEPAAAPAAPQPAQPAGPAQ